MKTKYRIVHCQNQYRRIVMDLEYTVEVWSWWFPVWVMLGHYMSIEGARAAIERDRNPIVEYVE